MVKIWCFFLDGRSSVCWLVVVEILLYILIIIIYYNWNIIIWQLLCVLVSKLKLSKYWNILFFCVKMTQNFSENYNFWDGSSSVCWFPNWNIPTSAPPLVNIEADGKRRRSPKLIWKITNSIGGIIDPVNVWQLLSIIQYPLKLIWK